MLQYSYKRNYEKEPYWSTNNFWPEFTTGDQFDHAYLVDIFKTVLGEWEIRKAILEHTLCLESIICNKYESDSNQQVILNNITETWKKCKRLKKSAYITWFYPPQVDVNGHLSSHYSMLICNPICRTIVSIDSRGTTYAVREHPEWSDSLLRLKSLFKNCTWIDYIEQDIQSLSTEDHFCQTWSLIFAIEYSKQITHKSTHELSAIDETNISDQFTDVETVSNTSRIVIDLTGDSDTPPVATNSASTSKHDTNTNNKISAHMRLHQLLYLNHNTGIGSIGFTPIIAFWKQILRISCVREAIYYEIYRQTHSVNGARHYERYFSTLEQLVCSGSEVYYRSIDLQASNNTTSSTKLENAKKKVRTAAIRSTKRSMS